MKRTISVMLFICLMLTSGSESAISAELVVDIDQVVSIESPDGGYRVLLTFELPGNLTSSEIEYSKLVIDYVGVDSQIVLELCSISRSWDVESVSWNYPWSYPGGDCDEYPQSKLRLYPNSRIGKEYFFDVSENVRNLLDGELNYGFLIKPSNEYGNAFGYEFLTILNNNSSIRIILYTAGN